MALTEFKNETVKSMPFDNKECSVEILKTRNKELTADISILKRLVYMLNVELELRDFPKKETEFGLSDESKSNSQIHLKPDNILRWNHEDIMMIDPLLKAFQQTKEEKDQLLQNYKRVFDELSGRCKELVLENDVLREQLHEAKLKADSTYVEWKKIQRDFLLMKEHNQLLTRQTKLFQNKIRNIESVYKAAVQQCDTEKHELQEKLETIKTELFLLKGRCSVLTQVNNQSKHQNEDQTDINFYNLITKGIKDISTDLKLHTAKDNDLLRKKIAALEEQKSEMRLELTKISSERDQLNGYVSAVELEARKLNNRYEELETELQNAKKSQGNAKKQIVKCMVFIRELVDVHNSLLGQVDETEDINCKTNLESTF